MPSSPDSASHRTALGRLFAPAPPRPRLPEAEVRRKYPKRRWQILEATFIGYATYYLVRNNLPVVANEVGDALAYSKDAIGNIFAATAIAYGLGKFLMGALSDRSNPRYFMPAGLALSAVCNFAFGWVNDYSVHLMLWTLNGFVQGMGWPPGTGTACASAAPSSVCGTWRTTSAAASSASSRPTV